MRLQEVKVERYAAYVILFGGIFLLARGILAPLLSAALPFLLAWGVAYVVRPLALRISRYTRMPRGILSVVLVFLLVAAAAVALYFGVRRAATELVAFGERLGEEGRLSALADRLSEMLERVGSGLSFLPDAGQAQTLFSDWLLRAGGALGEWALSAAGRLFSALPSFFLFLGVSLCAAFYFALDLDGIHRALRGALPRGAQAAVTRVKEGALYAALGYLRAYLILAAITFGVLTVGFLLLGVRYAVLLALLFAALDFLPVIGVNILLIPWGIYELIGGNYYLGIGLFILAAALALLRQFAEPRILSRRFGTHPLASLAGMYVGLRLFGFLGLLLGPVLAMVAQRVAGEWLARREGEKEKQKPHP